MKRLFKKIHSIFDKNKRKNLFKQLLFLFWTVYFLSLNQGIAQVKINKAKFNYVLTDSILTEIKPVFLKVVSKDSTVKYYFKFSGQNCSITPNSKQNNMIKIDKSKNGPVKIYVSINQNGRLKLIDSLSIFARNTQFQDYCHTSKCCMDSLQFQEYKNVNKIIFRTDDSTEDGSEEFIFDSTNPEWEKYQKIAWAYVLGCNKGKDFSNKSAMTGGFSETFIVRTPQKTYTFKSSDKELKCKQQIMKIEGILSF